MPGFLFRFPVHISCSGPCSCSLSSFLLSSQFMFVVRFPVQFPVHGSCSGPLSRFPVHVPCSGLCFGLLFMFPVQVPCSCLLSSSQFREQDHTCQVIKDHARGSSILESCRVRIPGSPCSNANESRSPATLGRVRGAPNPTSMFQRISPDSNPRFPQGGPPGNERVPQSVFSRFSPQKRILLAQKRKSTCILKKLRTRIPGFACSDARNAVPLEH